MPPKHSSKAEGNVDFRSASGLAPRVDHHESLRSLGKIGATTCHHRKVRYGRRVYIPAGRISEGSRRMVQLRCLPEAWEGCVVRERARVEIENPKRAWNRARHVLACPRLRNQRGLIFRGPLALSSVLHVCLIHNTRHTRHLPAPSRTTSCRTKSSGVSRHFPFPVAFLPDMSDSSVGSDDLSLPKGTSLTHHTHIPLPSLPAPKSGPRPRR